MYIIIYRRATLRETVPGGSAQERIGTQTAIRIKVPQLITQKICTFTRRGKPTSVICKPRPGRPANERDEYSIYTCLKKCAE